MRFLLKSCALLVALTAAAPVLAQTLPAPAWNVQTWRPGMAPDDGLLTKSAQVPGHMDASAWLGFGYARTPLKLQNTAVGASQTLVGDLGTVEFGGALGLWDKGLIGASLPIAGVIRSGGDNLAQLEKPAAPAMGDLRIDARWQIWSMKDDDFAFHLGLAGVGELPTAKAGSMMGGAWAGAIEALATAVWGPWRTDLNLGLRGQASQSLRVHPVDAQGFTIENGTDTTIARSGSVWLVRGAARRGFDDDTFGLRAELQAQGTLLTNALPKGQAVVDVVLGGDVRIADAWRIFAMAGGAPTSAMGSAGLRLAAGVQFDARKINRDQDADGILDAADKCPLEAEDKDGFEDADGCPDVDDDADGIADNSDKCPRIAEDRDGYEDSDGCPELDNDKDGIADAQDKCPNVSEDIDNFEDTDGCPDPDNDKDGILDVDDLCPSSPETKNGFEDGDGCPDVAPAPKVDPPKVVEPPKVVPPPPPPPKVEKPLTKKEKAALAKKQKAEKAAAVKKAKVEKAAAAKQAKAEKAAAKKNAKADKAAAKKASAHKKHAGKHKK
jgi:hypothetical protein